MMKALEQLKDEDKFGLGVTAVVHLVLIIFFLIYTFSLGHSIRPSYINVQFGAFKSGTQTEFSEKQHKKVATSPNPSNVEPEKPQPEKPEPVEEKVVASKETTKPVDSPDQKKEVEDTELKTPDTDKINPHQKTSTKKKQDVVIPPKARQDEVQRQGAKTSGDPEGTEGAVDADQGSGNEKEKAAPFNLKIEGLNRDPLVQPLPNNEAAVEATITLQFEVTPSGNLINIIPLRKSGNPALDRKTINILKRWQFSRLPNGVPQQNQTGTITFHFVAN